MSECTFFKNFVSTNCNPGIPFNLNSFNLQTKTQLFAELGLIHCASNPHDDIDKTNICQNHLNLIHQISANRRRKQSCEIPASINAHKKLSLRSKRTAISADRKIGVEHVHIIYGNTGYVLPVGTAICRSCRKKLLPSQHTDITDEIQIEDYTETAVEFDLDNGRKSGGLSSKETTEETETLLSDTETSEANTQQSQGSLFNPENFSQETDSQNHHDENNNPLPSLNAFLNTVNLSPVQRMRVSFSNAGERIRGRYISKAKACISAVLNTICPGEEQDLYEHLFSIETVVDEDLEEAIKQAYENSDTWTSQRQLLSVIATNKSYNFIKKLIPSVSYYRYKIAKRHGLKYGVGCPVPFDSKYRQTVEPEKIESFVDFITSSEVIKDMPFGEKKMKLSSGKVIPTPNVIRCIAPAAIVRQYDQYCEENDIEKLGHSTMYRIMQVCPASVQKSMEGLDYFVVEGGRAFEDLLWVVTQFRLCKAEMDQMIKDLSECKQYLKHDFKIHLEEKTDIKDHCMTFSLNDKDLHFRNECCDHQHLSGCPKCLQLSML